MILANSRGALNIFVLTNIIINFVFNKEAQVTFKEEDIYKGIYRVLESQFLEFRFSKKINNILVCFHLDLLADQIHRVSQEKLKAQMKIVKIKEVLRDIKRELKLTKEQILNQITISIVYKPKAQKVRPINKNNSTRDTPREKPDQYKHSFERDTPQEYISQFKDHLLPQRAVILQGFQMTPK